MFQDFLGDFVLNSMLMCFQIFQMPKHHIQESALMLGK
ncbi:unknown [Firmicutes bacterium CAG:103]|nr:unknown [Firmicutes bacterium CAG:103]